MKDRRLRAVNSQLTGQPNETGHLPRFAIGNQLARFNQRDNPCHQHQIAYLNVRLPVVSHSVAHVVELRLVRREPSVLRIWQRISERGPRGGPPFKAVLVSFMLRDVLEVAIQGFSPQNVIGGLKIRMAEPIQVHSSLVGIGVNLTDHELELEPCAGAFGIVRATIETIVIEAASAR